MKAHWWSCVLGIFCMPAEVLLSTWTVSQHPLSIGLMRVDSSAEIKCTTSLPDPLSLVLHRSVHGEKELLYLSLSNGRVTRNTTAPEFRGRIHITDQQVKGGHGIALRLSLLRPNDTDMYRCSWTHFQKMTSSVETLYSKATMIIVRERDPKEHCSFQIVDLVLIALCVTAFTVIVMLCIGALILRCTKFKKHFRPARVVNPPRPNRPLHVCPQQEVQHCPYLITSTNTLDFRGIL